MYSVIFDMDGTLLDTQKICIPAWEYAGKLQGIDGLGEEVKKVCGMNKKGWSEYLSKNFPSLDVDRFNLQMREYIVENQVVRYKKGAEELLEFLKENDIKIGLASGSSRMSVDHHIKEVSAEKYFCATVCGAEVVNGKPAPDIFLRTAELMGVNHRECIVFEDSANGVRSAVAAGMRCIGVPDIAEFGDDIKQLLYKHLDSLDEAIEILSKL